METILQNLGVKHGTTFDLHRKDAIVIVKTKHVRKLEVFKREGEYSIEYVPEKFPYRLFGNFETQLINVYNIDQLVETIKNIRIISETEKTLILLFDETRKVN